MAIGNQYLSVTEAAETFCVSRQRMHVLLRTYNVETETIGNQKLVAKKELAKIPKNRPLGRQKTKPKK